MALYWPDERVAVSCGEPGEELPADVLLVSMRAEQATDPEFVETVRDIVMGRSLARRNELLAELIEEGSALPVPEGDTPPADDATPEERAEHQLMLSLLDDGPEDCLWDELASELPARRTGIALGEAAAGAQVVVSHCDTMLVRR